MQKSMMLALLLVCGTAHAADWVSVGKTDSGYHSFVDVSSIRIDGSIRKFWTKGVPQSNTVRGPGANAHKSLSYFLAREAINCEDQTYRVESKVAYFDDGTTLDAPAEPSNPWKPIPPESRAEDDMKLVCAWKPN